MLQDSGKDGNASGTLATRSFALHCIVTLLDAVTTDSSPLAAATLLQAQAQAVVQCAFEAIEDSSAETLKPPSLLVLCRLLQSAQTVSQAMAKSDSKLLQCQLSMESLPSCGPLGGPGAGGGLTAQSSQPLRNIPEDSDDAVCMDVYAAPYVTALKTCLQPDAPVSIATAAVRLAESVLTSGMLHEDGPSVQVCSLPLPLPLGVVQCTGYIAAILLFHHRSTSKRIRFSRASTCFGVKIDKTNYLMNIHVCALSGD